MCLHCCTKVLLWPCITALVYSCIPALTVSITAILHYCSNVSLHSCIVALMYHCVPALLNWSIPALLHHILLHCSITALKYYCIPALQYNFLYIYNIALLHHSSNVLSIVMLPKNNNNCFFSIYIISPSVKQDQSQISNFSPSLSFITSSNFNVDRHSENCHKVWGCLFQTGFGKSAFIQYHIKLGPSKNKQKKVHRQHLDKQMQN